uniref:Large ribosomal subunit protein uL18c n=1 Tax=Ophidocladus simpliciusculus TaxID=1261574 RepID=A0A1Z1MJC2_9FLOR|nr:ribosomal protein L18 [Ophidocladus simpliciusculus]ARW66046.1 ribosomal protein L18 [Ophidocladus simpliciusculus]
MRNRNNKKTRLYIVKSNKHIYAHIIDDERNKILTSISTLSTEIKGTNKSLRNCTTARIVGKSIASKLKKLGIKKIIFDRGTNIYHGQIKSLANATREEGIIF